MLDNLLSSLLVQISASGRAADIELLVSDNASPDDTQMVAAKYRGQIRYWRNTENIGPDANFLKLFGEATGDFIWLPGDDDIVRDDGLSFILRMIDQHDFDFLYLRTKGRIKHGWKLRNARKLSNVEPLHSVNVYTTFMTSQVIRSSLIKPNLQAARVHLGGFMAYYWIFLESLAKSTKCFVSNEKEVFPGKTENTGGYRFYRVWGEAVMDVMHASSFANDQKACAIMRFRLFFVLLLPITYRLRSGGSRFSFHAENPAEGLRKYFSSDFYKIILLAYLRMPYFCLKPLHFGVRLIAHGISKFQNDIV